MPPAIVVWIGLLGAVFLVWVSRHVAITRARHSHRLLSSRSYPGPPDPPPRLSVLVAAKDEEENIENCVRTLCEQDYPDFEVIAVDDRSSDRTPAILRELENEFPAKLKVLTVKRLRDGWFGKNNAMREAVGAADGQWLCLTDADCRQVSNRTLSMAMAEALAGKTDLLSVLPVLETKTFWERLIQPVCAAIMLFWYHPDRVNDPKKSAAYANGAFMLINRATYEAIGGHERVRAEVNEDMHMARLTKEAGRRLQVIQNDDLYRTRMYSSFGQTWRGWSRIFYGCLGSYRKLGSALLILTTFSILPWISLIASGMVLSVWGASAGAGWVKVLLMAGATVIAQQTVMWRFYGLVRTGPVWSIGYLIGAFFCWGMLVNATTKLGGLTRTTWRGTTYRAERVEGEPPDPASGGAIATQPEEVRAGAP